ncbi:DNA repair protein REV1 [Madurella mycetomatis]|uniref:DNA repair protein REV1 n=1 Tax=Madurella mycetomatis TaxID=100816 RepID=A0A175VYV6_9PEZI|nr:DNA repair protein REV1 [Madurella mycetomatis]
MPPPHPKLPLPAEPRYGRTFDPWNSVSAGHQRAEVGGPQGWRESRNIKMNNQFRAGNSGGQRISGTVGAGSGDFDQRLGMFMPKKLHAHSAKSVADMLRNPGSMRAVSVSASVSTYASCLSPGKGSRSEDRFGSGVTTEEWLDLERKTEDEARGEGKARQAEKCKIFDGLVIYVNGSTHPLVSDHKLKYLLLEHGARMSLHLGRRQVTHVILGKPSGPSGGAGGGLAGGKLEKEIRRVGGHSVKFVSVEWALESIKAGKRLPEARFANLKIAARGQQSVLGAFSKAGGSTQCPAAGVPGG